MKVTTCYQLDERYKDLPVESVPSNVQQLQCLEGGQDHPMPVNIKDISSVNPAFYVYPFATTFKGTRLD